MCAQAPNITYSGVAASYPLDIRISALTPTNTGGAVTVRTTSTLAGDARSDAGYKDGTGTAALFREPYGVAVDASGNVYVADQSNHRIRKITAAGVVTTLAGSGFAVFLDGTGAFTGFNSPTGVAVDASGNVYVADYKNHRIRKITAAGEVTTLAGSGNEAFEDGTGTAASFNYPTGVAVDASGNVYVADQQNHRIRKITAAGVVTTLAGGGRADDGSVGGGYANGTGAAASFYHPAGVAVDASGNVYVADESNQRIRKITAAGVVTTLAGSGTAGFQNGTGAAASFSEPRGVTVDASGNVYVADYGNNSIRKITSAGVVTTLAGTNGRGSHADGTTAFFSSPSGVAVDASGNVYVADNSNNAIRKILQGNYSIAPALPTGLSMDPATGVISGTPTVATASTTYKVTAENTNSSGTTTVTFSVVSCATPTTYTLTGSTGVAIALSNSGTGLIYQLKKDATDVVAVAGTGSALYFGIQTAAGTYTVIATEGGCAASMMTGSVVITATPAPNIAYSGVAASYPLNTAISALVPTNSGSAVTGTYGAVTTLAGSGTLGSADGTSTAASFNSPAGVAIDASGNVYVADFYNHRIRKITAAGVVTTFAGSGTAGFTDGTSTVANFNSPSGVAVDASGNVYVGDQRNHRIRKITAAGVVTTLAGSGTAGFADGTGTVANFNYPYGVAVDASGNVYVADQSNKRIRKITAAGEVTTLAGSGTQAFADGTGTAASFNYPTGVTVDASGNVYVADYGNHSIRKITAAGVVTTLAGSGTDGYADGTGTTTRFSRPLGVAVDASGNVYVADQVNHRIRKITSAGVVTTLAGSGMAALANGTGTAASFYFPQGVALDASGNLYVADFDNHSIRKISLTGYIINPALPTGLSINPATGVINGTPTVPTASTAYTITATNAVGSSAKTVTFSVAAVLPIELSDFKGTPSLSGNLLTWTTASETQNKGFDIERSTDGSIFHSIGQVKGNNKPSSYQFVDNQPFATSYYRLRQRDNDGKETLSKVISIVQTGKGKGLKIYPTLVSNGILTVDTEGGQFQIFNLLGQQVLNHAALPTSARFETSPTLINISALPQGTYVLKVGTEVAKFVKQ